MEKPTVGRYYLDETGREIRDYPIPAAKRDLIRSLRGEAATRAHRAECIITVGDRVEGGEGANHDTGIVLSIDGQMAVVAWDSHIQTAAPLTILRRI